MSELGPYSSARPPAHCTLHSADLFQFQEPRRSERVAPKSSRPLHWPQSGTTCCRVLQRNGWMFWRSSLIISDKQHRVSDPRLGPDPWRQSRHQRDLQRSKFQRPLISRLWTNMIVRAGKPWFEVDKVAEIVQSAMKLYGNFLISSFTAQD